MTFSNTKVQFITHSLEPRASFENQTYFRLRLAFVAEPLREFISSLLSGSAAAVLHDKSSRTDQQHHCELVSCVIPCTRNPPCNSIGGDVRRIQGCVGFSLPSSFLFILIK